MATSSEPPATPLLAPPKPDALGALRFGGFRLLYANSIATTLAQQMQWVISSYLVYELSGSAVQLGLVSAARALPLILFSLIGGAVADRMDRKRLLIVTQTLSAVQAALLALFTLSGAITVGHLYLFTFGISAVNAFYGPARQAILPAIVPRSHMVSAVTHANVVRIGATFIGPSVAGALLTFTDAGVSFAVTAALFCAGAPLLLLLAIKADPVRDGPRPNSFHMIREGVRFVSLAPETITLLLLDFIATFFGAYRQLMPIFAKDILNVGPDGLGLLLSASGLGSLLGSGIVVWMGDVQRRGRIVLLSTALYAAGLFAFGASPALGGFTAALALSALLGCADAVAGTFRSAIIIIRTPDELQGRVQSVAQMFIQGGPALGGVGSGILAAALGAPLTIILGSAVCLGAVEIARRKVRQMHEV